MASGSSLTAISRIRWNLQSRRARPSNKGLELTKPAQAMELRSSTRCWTDESAIRTAGA
jgi:hypothetical protein